MNYITTFALVILAFTLLHYVDARIPKVCCNGNQNTGCRPRCHRKNYKNLTPDEWKNFATAFSALATKKGEERGLVEQIADEHGEHFDDVHSKRSFLFFTYHSLLLAELEMAMHQFNGACLPYWDYPTEKETLLSSPILSANFLGPKTPCTQCWTGSQVFSEFQFLKGTCVSRCFPETHEAYLQVLQLAPGDEYDNFIVPRRFSNYSSRSTSVLNSHGSIHFLFGNTMKEGIAPKDPSFHVLHTYAEKKHAESYSDWEFHSTRQLFDNEEIPVYGMTIKQFYEEFESCYTYDEFLPIVNPKPNPNPNTNGNPLLTPTTPNPSVPIAPNPSINAGPVSTGISNNGNEPKINIFEKLHVHHTNPANTNNNTPRNPNTPTNGQLSTEAFTSPAEPLKQSSGSNGSDSEPADSEPESTTSNDEKKSNKPSKPFKFEKNKKSAASQLTVSLTCLVMVLLSMVW